MSQWCHQGYLSRSDRRRDNRQGWCKWKMMLSCIMGIVGANVFSVLPILGTKSEGNSASAASSAASHRSTNFVEMQYYIAGEPLLHYTHANIQKKVWTPRPFRLHFCRSEHHFTYICVEALRLRCSIRAIIQWSSFSMWLINIRIHLLTSRCMFLRASAEPIEHADAFSNRRDTRLLLFIFFKVISI